MTDGIENFEVTDWDLENEFNPDRVRHRLTKKQQIYGVFASDSDEEDEKPGFGIKGKAAYNSHINFISGGIRTVGEKDETKKGSDDEDEQGSSDEEVPVKPPIRKNVSFQRSGFSGGHKPNQLAGLRNLPREGSGSEFGGWEKYTKGIGQKLLQKMGYEPGKGLGKSLQGITTPIEAKLRKGKGAIGLYGPEQSMKRVPDASQVTNLDATEEKKPRQRQWKKKTTGEKQKIKYVYQTAKEVAEEGSRKRFRDESISSSTLSSVKVIDMTGPEQRVLSGYHQIHQQHSKPPEQEVEETEPKISTGYHFSLPELEHNLKLLEEDEKKKIIRSEQQKNFASDRIICLGQEEDRLVQVLKQEEKQFKTLEKVLKIIDSLEEKARTEESNETLEIAARTFKELQEEHYEEYKMYNLSDLAITIVGPIARKLLIGWNPLKQHHHCIDVFKDWKDLLESGRNVVAWNKGSDSEMDHYTHLVWDVWMPPVRQAILTWDARQWEPMIRLLETWMPLLPPWIVANILDQLVLPKLQAEIENWNPLTDTVPVHSWMHPWHPLMGVRLEPLYFPIRQKLASALVKWHPSDCSAKLILEPWKNVFSRGIMDAFIVNNIIPKLEVALQNYIINPHQQHLDIWKWVMDWLDLIPEPCMVTLLDKNFFPRWLQVLYTWLTHNPSYEEVEKWYRGWKSMMPASLMNNPIIKEKFQQAIDIMTQAGTSQWLLATQPGAKESLAYLANVEQQEFEHHSKPRRDYEGLMQAVRSQMPTQATDITLSFKELIQKRAMESNVIFMPVYGRYQEGKQVYRFGSSLLYLDKGTILVFNEKTWVPTSLQSLLDMAC